MYDPKMNASFTLKSKEKFNPEWYKGEPVSCLFVLATRIVSLIILICFNQSKMPDSLELLITYFIYYVCDYSFVNGD